MFSSVSLSDLSRPLKKVTIGNVEKKLDAVVFFKKKKKDTRIEKKKKTNAARKFGRSSGVQ